MKKEIKQAKAELEKRKTKKFMGQLNKMANSPDGEITAQDHRRLSFMMGDEEVKEKVNVYYCTEKGKIKGLLEISTSRIFFEPVECEENNHLKKLKPY